MVFHDISDAVRDRLFGDLCCLVDHVADNVEGVLVIETDATQETVRQRGFFRHLDRMAGFEAFDHDRRGFLGDADDFCFGLCELHAQRDSGDETAAGERHQDSIYIREVFHDLQRDRALPADDLFVVKGRDDGNAFFFLQFIAVHAGVVLRFPVLEDGRSPAPDVLHLDGGNMARHADGGGDAQFTCDVGDCHAVVAGGECAYTDLFLLVRQSQDLVGGAAHFEGPDRLQVLQFQIDLRSGLLTERGRIHQRGARDVRADAVCCCLDVSGLNLFIFIVHSIPPCLV